MIFPCLSDPYERESPSKSCTFSVIKEILSAYDSQKYLIIDSQWDI